MIISWALFDLFLMLGQIVAGGTGGGISRRLAFGAGSVLLLWAGVLAAGNGTGSVQWSLMPPGGPKMALWMVAGLLRIGAYPFHLSTATAVTSRSTLVATLLLSPVTGWALWIRLILVSGTVLAENAWVITLALLTIAVGGFVGWAVKSPREGRSWIGMGICGVVLLAVVLASLLARSQGAGEDTVLAILALGATSWILSVTMLFLGGGLDPGRASRREMLPRSIASVLGALSLIGVPPTLGFVAESPLLGGLNTAEQWSWRVGFFLGQLFLVMAVARWLFPPVPPQRSDADQGNLLGRMARDAGLILPALLLVALGVAPAPLLAGSFRLSLRSMLSGPGLVGWLLWGGALLLGGVLAWQDATLRPRVSLWLDVLQDVVRLDWAFALLGGAFEQGLSVIRAVDDVLGGRGALLWSLIMFLLLILVWRVR
jgi:formate hydrogenlyase subunit 3/multisubunit Na+/H+ antiporter MnhD subunit